MVSRTGSAHSGQGPGGAALRAGILTLLVLLGEAGGCGDSTKPVDTTNPAMIRDLAVAAVGDSTVTLTWTAVGDDGMTGAVASYDLRWLDTPLSDQDWVSATPFGGVPVPHAPGTRDGVVVDSLPLDRLLYFGLKAKDAAGNVSLLSNIVSARPGPPLCVVTPDSLTFGALYLGGSFDLSVTVRNRGGGTLIGQAAIDCPAFSLVTGGQPFSLLTGQSRTVTVRFQPQDENPASCRLQLGTSCGAVRCSGFGAPVVAPVMVKIEAGTFEMGSPEAEGGRSADEVPHQVTLSRPYYVAQQEVTQLEWKTAMGWVEGESGADQPAIHLTWFDALQFCNILSRRDGYSASYNLGQVEQRGNHIVRANVVWFPDSTGYRLPSEAEWEWACRAGSATAFFSGKIYEEGCEPLDASLDPVGWYCGNSSAGPRPVRQKTPNAWALYDTHGNAFEWCWDWYAAYPSTGSEPQTDPVGPELGDGRVVRGGSFDATPAQCRSAFRLYLHPDGNHADVGLRLVRNAAE
jgi:formylglycine-generating enzyme required for sulfatase activity